MKKNITKRDYIFFDIHDKKFSTKAKEYRHEIFHLTRDLFNINVKIQKSLALCVHFITILGQPSKRYQVKFDSGLEILEELRYHLENFIFRLHPYREKLCLFINFALKVDYHEDERQLLRYLCEHHLIKSALLDTELKKLDESPFKEFMSKRKLMSHKSYYDSGLYNPYFMPTDESLSPKKIGVKKASIEWRKNIKREPELVNDCLSKIFDLNEKMARKIISNLNK